MGCAARSFRFHQTVTRYWPSPKIGKPRRGSRSSIFFVVALHDEFAFMRHTEQDRIHTGVPGAGELSRTPFADVQASLRADREMTARLLVQNALARPAVPSGAVLPRLT